MMASIKAERPEASHVSSCSTFGVTSRAFGIDEPKKFSSIDKAFQL